MISSYDPIAGEYHHLSSKTPEDFSKSCKKAKAKGWRYTESHFISKEEAEEFLREVE